RTKVSSLLSKLLIEKSQKSGNDSLIELRLQKLLPLRASSFKTFLTLENSSTTIILLINQS
uniref:Ovule protein n=1 Tax=Romanomermis culicivorax TaxID=13658 RepID=A0A915JV79_ROMCU